ncbi:MAG TPA: polysaccharide deacetylase family protein [Candidatus Dormibacteraeota bacterium]|nr:polysaccharide deacetylase family protein [Candidatus Dormibacteraeota bacterium]
MGSTRKSITVWVSASGVSLVVLGLTGPGAAARGTDLPEWQQPAYVQSAEPSGNAAPTDASIVVTFSEATATNGVALTIEPHVDGQLSWDDLFTLRYRPFVGWAHAATYHVWVHGRSVAGAPLKGQTSWDFTTIDGPQIALAPGPAAIRVPILMYHYIRINPDPRDYMGFRLSVKPSDFAAQMDWLTRNGYHPVTTLDVINYLSGARGLPSRPIVLTFDDGYADFYTAAVPILRQHDFTAVAYVVSGFVDQPGYMSARQIQELQAAGFEIGSHTVHHVNLTTQSLDALNYELATSKQTLERLLGRPVTAFCYPSGRFGWREAGAVAAAGYQDATTTLGGSYRTMAGRYTWSRLRVSGGEYLSEFAWSVLNDS